MTFLDVVNIVAESGSGGNGCLSFRRERFIPKGGPNGGNGGKGGDIVFIGNKNFSSLNMFNKRRYIKAENGKNGQGSNKNGKRGKDLILHVPIGTEIFDLTTNSKLFDFTFHEEKKILLLGGRGGLGNTCFKSSKNQVPFHSTNGAPGKRISLQLNLKINSDIGLIGLPNAGKSTFLSSITYSKTKVASYPFSTIDPEAASIYYENKKYTILDIPGLIKNSSKKKGLGIKFLKHIEKCRLLIHLVDISSKNILEDFFSIRKELENYSTNILKKNYILCLSKSDLVTTDVLKKKIQNIKKNLAHNNVYVVSHYNLDKMYKVILDAIIKINKFNL